MQNSFLKQKKKFFFLLMLELASVEGARPRVCLALGIRVGLLGDRAAVKIDGLSPSRLGEVAVLRKGLGRNLPEMRRLRRFVVVVKHVEVRIVLGVARVQPFAVEVSPVGLKK
jgi:hypothetical protein